MEPFQLTTRIVLIATALVAATVRADLSVLSQTISFRRLEIPGGNGDMAIVSLRFDKAIGLRLPGRADSQLSEFKGVNITQRGNGEQDATPLLFLALRGLASLRCVKPDQGVAEWNMTGDMPQNGPPTDLLPAPPTDEPGSSFLSSLGGYTFDAEWHDDRLNFLLLMEGWFDGNHMSNKGATRSLLPTWDCRLRFTNSSAAPRIVDPVDGAVFTGDTSSLTPSENECTSAGVERIRLAFQGLTAAMQNVTSKSQLNALDMTAGAVSLFEAWEGCQAKIESFFTQENGTMTLPPTKQCTEPYGSPEYLASPCCNEELAYSQCCVATTREMKYVKVGAARMQPGACRQPEAIVSILVSYVEARESAVLIQQANSGNDMSSRWDTLTQFISDCNSELQSTTCVVDSDCIYTHSCNQQSGTCNFDYENSQHAYAACFVDKMDPTLKSELVRQFGLNALSDTLAEDFASKFEERVFDLDCVGPAADRYRQQWKETVDSRGNRYGYMTAVNATGCLLDKQCNWNRWENTDEEKCTGASVLASRGASFCGIRNGSGRDLQDLSVPSQCQAVAYFTQSECEAAGAGHAWVAFQGSFQGSCVRTDINTLAECLSTAPCLPYKTRLQNQIATGTYSPFSPANWDPQCASTMCFHQGWNQTFCEGLRARAGGLGFNHPAMPLIWSLGWDANTGVCGANLGNLKSAERNATSCAVLSSALGLQPDDFSFQEGHMFRPGQWSTAQECTVGRCNIPALSYYGVNGSTCEAREYCTQSCARCKTYQRDQTGQNERVLCYSTAINSSVNCPSPGLWRTSFAQREQGNGANSTVHSYCEFPYSTRASCEANPGLVFRSCPDLSTREECVFDSSMPWEYRLLQCTYDTHTDCLTQDECEQQGQCNDWDMQTCQCSPGSGCSCSSGACISPWVGGRQQACGGNDFNQGFRPTRFGCMDTTVSSEQECSQKEGNWHWEEKAFTEAACLAHGTGCKAKESRWGGQQIGRNASECTKCGGKPESKYTWTWGRVVPGQQQELTWTNRSWVSTNQLKQTLSFNKLQVEVSSAVAAIFAREMMNRLNSVVQKRIATFLPISRCCSATDTGEECFPLEVVPDAQCAAQPGSDSQVCESPAGSVELPAGAVTSLSGAMVSTSVVLYGTAVANASATAETGSSSAGTLSRKAVGQLFMAAVRKDTTVVTVSPASNDVVLNSHGAVVGEIISNALVLVETPNITFPLRVCVPILASAAQDTAAYPVQDLCSATLLVGPPLSLVVDEQGSALCANVTAFGAYFACNRLEDWANVTPSSQASSKDMPAWEFWTIIGASIAAGLLIFGSIGYYWYKMRQTVAYTKVYHDQK